MKGVYTLIIDLDEDLSFRLRSLGNLTFEKGTWLYVGSAMGKGSTSLENRIRRHFRSEKTTHWHIDHLLKTGLKIRAAIWSESSVHIECDIAKSIGQINGNEPGPKGFGASDCKQKCWTHLFRSNVENGLERKIKTVFTELNLEPRISRDGKI
ncbi:MAG: GIY-YIG nuclease family protein [Candidatus Thorarchaeota archaeon]|nr:MAG: GIY-YIG nuclease family protein [Candidatus Thorarchaeota archaeon]